MNERANISSMNEQVRQSFEIIAGELFRLRNFIRKRTGTGWALRL
jgi:hypothetical protein